MLTIEMKINGRLIGGAIVRNVSDLADLSDYDVEVVEQGSDQTGCADYREKFAVRNHNRRQTAWALVEKIAALVVSDRQEPI